MQHLARSLVSFCIWKSEVAPFDGSSQEAKYIELAQKQRLPYSFVKVDTFFYIKKILSIFTIWKIPLLINSCFNVNMPKQDFVVRFQVV